MGAIDVSLVAVIVSRLQFCIAQYYGYGDHKPDMKKHGSDMKRSELGCVIEELSQLLIAAQLTEDERQFALNKISDLWHRLERDENVPVQQARRFLPRALLEKLQVSTSQS